MAAGVRKPYTQDRLGIRLGVGITFFSLLLVGKSSILKLLFRENQSQ